MKMSTSTDVHSVKLSSELYTLLLEFPVVSAVYHHLQ